MKGRGFTVRANPVLLESGDSAGTLDYVRFTADNDEGEHREWRTGSGEIDAALHTLESSGMRYEVLNQLRSGARVDLPGAYSADTLAELGLKAGA